MAGRPKSPGFKALAPRPSSQSWSWSCSGWIAIKRPAFSIGIALALAALSIPIIFAKLRISRLEGPGHPPQGWTSVDLIRDTRFLRPDTDIRQAWIYGEAGGILQKDGLAQAKAIEDQLLAGLLLHDAVSAGKHGVDPPETGFRASIHSILSLLDAPALGSESHSPISAINNALGQSSRANITLQPASVLAGITTNDKTLTAADAIVITLFSTQASRAGELWHHNAENLASHHRGWDVVIGEDVRPSKLIRVQVKPASFADGIIFYAVYSAALLYAAWSWAGANALRSRAAQLGIMAVQVCMSTACAVAMAAVAGMDVSSVPGFAFPLVPLAQCLGNSLRLVDEIERTSLQRTPSLRMSAAFKQLGNWPLLVTAQNGLLFSLLSMLSPRGLASFCHFAILSLLFDLFFFLTFFSAFLSLNLKPINLQESFSDKKRHVASRGGGGPEGTGNDRRSLAGVLASRYTASFVLIVACVCFIAWQFSEHGIFSGADGWRKLERYPVATSLFTSPGSPGQPDDVEAWFRMQDLLTLREVVSRIKPGSSTFLARTFPPLVIRPTSVCGRTSGAAGLRGSVSLESVARSDILVAAVAFSGAFLLFLLWRHVISPDGSQRDSITDTSTEISSIQCLPPGHSLDVFILASGARRFLVSVGFDHQVRLWDLESPTATSQLIPCSPECGVSWPITMVSIDSKAEWIAICSREGQAALWNRQHERFGPPTSAGARIVTCVFARVPGRDRFQTPTTQLFLVLETGSLIDLGVDTGKVVTAQICKSQVRSAHVASKPRMPAQLITIAESGEVFVSVNRDGWWSTRRLHFASLNFASPTQGHPLRFSVIPSLRGVGIAYDEERANLHLVDIFSGTLIYTFQGRSIQFQTLRALHSPPQSCIYCGSTAVASFSVAYTERESGAFVMTTISAENNPRYRTGVICLRSERDARERRCSGFVGGAEVSYLMSEPGVWEATGANGVAGVRRRKLDRAVTGTAAFSNGRLTNRRIRGGPARRAVEERWEAWTMTAKGIISSHLLTTSLMTSKSGPLCRLARNAVAVGLADLIVLVQFGKTLHDNDDEEGVVSKPTHGRLSRQNSRIGKLQGM